mgnify:CR=1 FL=1
MNSAIEQAERVPVLHDVTAQRFAEHILPAHRPVILRGLVEHWPAVTAGRGGPEAMAAYLGRFDGGTPIGLLAGASAIGGRFFYSDDLRGFNFERASVTLPVLLGGLLQEATASAPSALYAGAASAPDQFPGWVAENPLPLATPDAVPRIWIGNSSRVSAHYDGSSNIAAVVAGTRRFILFPPEQAENLYVGPFDFTMAGQPTSMVDLDAPDLARYPRFARAMEAMQMADLAPGDALFVPSFWWHEVRATGPLNVLVNYWWAESGRTPPFAALVHAMLAVRDLPAPERAAMRAWFDHYVFGHAGDAAAHLPDHARGILGAPSVARTQAIKAFLQRTLAVE